MNNLTTTLDSREVAEMIGKRHTDLLRDIETYSKYLLDNQNAILRSDIFFQKSSYKASTGKSYTCYKITKKGCELIAHKMTGKKGVLFTAEYINRFHEMEQALKEPKADYQYQPKTWLSVPVVTVSDICHFSGISRYTVREALKKHCILDEDYTVLSDSNLLHFKAENKTADLRMCKSLIVISQSGFAKLSACLANFPALEQCFSLPPAKKPPKDEHRKLSADTVNTLDTLDNLAKSIQSLIMCLKKSSHTFEDFKGRTETLLFLAFNLEITASEINNMNNPF